MHLQEGKAPMDDASSSSTSELSEKQEAERKRKADLAAKRRARIMAQMSKMQRNFIEENSELFESTSAELQQANSEMDLT